MRYSALVTTLLACSALTAASAAAQSAADPATGLVKPSPPPTESPPADQPPVSASASPAASGAPAQLGEIVVTAQRRGENLQRVPIAVTALTASQLQNSGIRSTEDLSAVTPALNVGEQSGYILPHLRGVGTTAFGAGLESSVAVYVDGVYLETPTAALFKLNNISQIEVLKGPQGTLFGRNATGGLIQVNTRDPTDTPHLDASVEYGNYDTVTATGYVSGPIAPRVDGDLAAYLSHQGDGYGHNLFNGLPSYKDDRDLAFRSKLLFDISETTKLKVSLDFEDSEGDNESSFRNSPGTVPLFGPSFNGSNAYDIDEDDQPYNTYKGGGVSGRLDQELGFANLVEILAYRRSDHNIGFDSDLTTTPAETLDSVNDREDQLSQELQLQSPAGSPIKWIIGSYYLHADGGYHPSQVSGFILSPLSAVQTNDVQTTNAASGYGQLTLPLPLLPDTNLTLGGRYSYESRQLVGSTNGLIGSQALVPLAQFNESKNFYRPTWRIALDHAFTRDLLGYLSYNRGFKSGGFNPGLPSDAAFAAETLDAYETGLKMEFLHRRLRLNPSIYYYDYKDIQVSHIVLGQIGYYNGAAAQLYGIDLDFDAAVTSRLTLSGGFALQQNRFTKFPNALEFPLVATGADASMINADGNRLPFAPREQVDLAIDYRQPLPLGKLNYNVTYDWTGVRYTEPANNLSLPSYSTLNASLTYTLPNDHYSVRLWARNLTDVAEPLEETTSSISSLAEFAPPRTYGFTLSASY